MLARLLLGGYYASMSSCKLESNTYPIITFWSFVGSYCLGSLG